MSDAAKRVLNAVWSRKDHVTLQDDAERAVCLIIEDLSDRKGLDHQWDAIDEGVREELVDTWLDIVRNPRVRS